MFIDEKKQKSDFIRTLIKYNLQAHETLKEYYLPYDKIKNYVQGSAKDFFLVRVRFFKLDLMVITGLMLFGINSFYHEWTPEKSNTENVFLSWAFWFQSLSLLLSILSSN